MSALFLLFAGVPQAAEGGRTHVIWLWPGPSCSASRHHSPGDHRGDRGVGGPGHAAAARTTTGGPTRGRTHLRRAVQGADWQHHGLQGGREAGGAASQPEGVAHGGHPHGHCLQAAECGGLPGAAAAPAGGAPPGAPAVRVTTAGGPCRGLIGRRADGAGDNRGSRTRARTQQ